MINIDKIKEHHLKIKNFKKSAYNKILEMILRMVEMKAIDNNEFCIYEVPDFLLGETNYNLKECCDYLIEKLKENKYFIDVSHYEPNIIFLKWKLT